MQVKVCGITTQKQLGSLSDETVNRVDLIGFNFYEPSKRYVTSALQMDGCTQVKVGVFVNASGDELKQRVEDYDLDMLQLHGDEDVEYCKAAQLIAPVIKVFRVGEDFDFTQVMEYQFCDYFLFDTFTSEYGGSGKVFDWSVLENYTGDRPFYLSGGIGPQSVAALRELDHPQLIGVDINSKFEVRPGMKDLGAVATFINELRK